jgi:hypothetical protein
VLESGEIRDAHNIHIIKNIYEVESALHIPKPIMFTSLQYKVIKKIEEKFNANDKKIYYLINLF